MVVCEFYVVGLANRRHGLALPVCWWYQVAWRACVGLTKLSCPGPFVGLNVECGSPVLLFSYVCQLILELKI